jgi:zinc D-Ala-D-Ala dipeptidase
MVMMPVLWSSCKADQKPEPIPLQLPSTSGKVEVKDYDTSLWTELKAEDGYVIDIRYATTDNFVKEAIYPCARFFLRPEVARALEHVRLELETQGYRLKLFDGYRPRPAQQKLWDKVPNPDYVAPPSEGSMHNRGVAIDLTLTDLQGVEIDMGTSYDFFGPEAHMDFQKLPQAVLDHRQKLKSVMENHGFQSIRTEWWHYSFVRGAYPLDNWQWPCQDQK